MKDGWSKVKLGNVIELLSGFAFKSSEYRQSGHFLMRIANVQDGFISLEKPKFVSLNSKTSRFELFAGDILTSLTGNVGRVAVVTKDHLPAALNQRIARIKVKDTAELDSSFLLWFLKSELFSGHLINAAHGTAQANVSPKEINEVPFFLPPLEEQKRIVSILDQAFEGLDRARANAEANLESARELFQSVMNNLFADPSIEWNISDLGSLGKIVTGSTPKRADKDCFGDHIPFIKPGDFREDGSLTYDNEGLSKKGENISRVSPAGSALMVCIGATIGKAGFTEKAVTTNQQINSIIPQQGVNGKYLYLQMLSSDFQTQVMHGSGQATLPIINKSKWSKLSVRIPANLKHQNAIVEQLFEIRALVEKLKIRLHERQIDNSSLRQSLLQKAFSGELT